MAAANAQFAQHGCVTLQHIAKMTGKSTNRVCAILKRFNWSFYLYQYSIHLTKEQKIARMEMARQFEIKIHADPHFLNRVWFSDESYFVVGLRKPGRAGTFLPPCECVKSDAEPCTCDHSQKRDVPVVKNPQKVMIWMAVNALRRPIWFVCPNEKLNTSKYITLMRRFKSQIESEHPGLLDSGTFVFMQDGAPAHTSYRSVRWLENYFTEVISKRPKKMDMTGKMFWVSYQSLN